MDCHTIYNLIMRWVKYDIFSKHDSIKYIFLHRLPRTYIINKKLDLQKMIDSSKTKTGEPYSALTLNCVDAVASVLIEGGFTELKDYKRWGVPTPGKSIVIMVIAGRGGLCLFDQIPMLCKYSVLIY